MYLLTVLLNHISHIFLVLIQRNVTLNVLTGQFEHVCQLPMNALYLTLLYLRQTAPTHLMNLYGLRSQFSSLFDMRVMVSVQLLM